MKHLRYLSGVLTVIAVLLTLNLFTLWTQAPGRLDFASTAEAAPGIPNAAAQRKEMIEALKESNKKMDALVSLLKSGNVKVKVEGQGGD